MYSRTQKILLALFKLSKGSKKPIRFEDIVVRVFKDFSADFQLRGYPEYPDSGDIVHKPLYTDLKKNGYLTSGDKYFALTDKGIKFAKDLLNMKDKPHDSNARRKLTKDEEKTLDRIKKSVALSFFLQGKTDEIYDIDFYNYLDVSVRTKKYDFIAKLNAVDDLVKILEINNDPFANILVELNKVLIEKFSKNIQFATK